MADTCVYTYDHKCRDCARRAAEADAIEGVRWLKKCPTYPVWERAAFRDGIRGLRVVLHKEMWALLEERRADSPGLSDGVIWELVEQAQEWMRVMKPT